MTWHGSSLFLFSLWKGIIVSVFVKETRKKAMSCLKYGVHIKSTRLTKISIFPLQPSIRVVFLSFFLRVSLSFLLFAIHSHSASSLSFVSLVPAPSLSLSTNCRLFWSVFFHPILNFFHLQTVTILSSYTT